MSLKFFKIVIIFLYIKNPTIFGDNHENITLDPLPELPFNYTPEPRIVGGYRPEPHTLAKYIVSIRGTNEHPLIFGFTHYCAGSIIAANRILTAAHCVFHGKNMFKPADLKVVARNSMRCKETPETEEINVKEIIYHSKYSKDTVFNDIALLILVKDIQLDGKLAEKISLPQHDIEIGKLCTVIGWGSMYWHGPMTNNLLYGDLHVRSRKYCRKKLPIITSKKICALNKYDEETTTCFGDSGGPLICSNGKDVVTGIVSYGYGCAKGIPSVYTNVYKYLDWIKAGKGNHLQPLAIMLWFSVSVCLCILQ